MLQMQEAGTQKIAKECGCMACEHPNIASARHIVSVCAEHKKKGANTSTCEWFEKLAGRPA